MYDFDNVHQTALHWAAKRNFVPIIRILIENGANVNAFDMVFNKTSVSIDLNRQREHRYSSLRSVEVLERLKHF